MGAGGIIAALAVGGGAAALLVIARRRAAAKAAQSPLNACDALKGVDDTAYAACKAVGGLGEIIAGIGGLFDGGPPLSDVVKARDAKNTQLNGAPDVELPLFWAECVHLSGNASNVLRYKNGCTPYVGSPGASKCAAGTELYTNQITSLPEEFMSGRQHFGAAAKNLYGVNVPTGDLTSGVWQDGKWDCSSRFPGGGALPAGGTRGLYRGRPWTCPAGQVAAFPAGRDHTGSDHSGDPFVAPQCVPGTAKDGPTVNVEPGGPEDTADRIGGSGRPGEAPVNTDDFCFVDGHWQRKYQGKCPVPTTEVGTFVGGG